MTAVNVPVSSIGSLLSDCGVPWRLMEGSVRSHSLGCQAPFYIAVHKCHAPQREELTPHAGRGFRGLECRLKNWVLGP
jgi:hypothetical protein